MNTTSQWEKDKDPFGIDRLSFYGKFARFEIKAFHMGIGNLYIRENNSEVRIKQGELFELIDFAERWTGEQDVEQEVRDFELINANEKLVLGSKMREIPINVGHKYEEANVSRNLEQFELMCDKISSISMGIQIPVRGQEVKNSIHRSLNLIA